MIWNWGESANGQIARKRPLARGQTCQRSRLRPSISASATIIRSLSSVDPTNGMSSCLRVTLAAPSAPTRYLVLIVSEPARPCTVARTPSASLAQRRERRAELDLQALPAKVLVQDAVGLALRDQQDVRIGDRSGWTLRALHRPGHSQSPHVRRHPGVWSSRGQHRLQHTDVLEDLECAGLHALGAGPRERALGCVDDAHVDAASQQVAGKRRAGWACADDQHVDLAHAPLAREMKSTSRSATAAGCSSGAICPSLGNHRACCVLSEQRARFREIRDRVTSSCSPHSSRVSTPCRVISR